MRTVVLFGTETGNAELAAEDLARAVGGETCVVDLATTDPAGLDLEALHLFVCSTYGEGELPASAQPFVDLLSSASPGVLDGLRYAVFGLGDSSYDDTFTQGAKVLDAALREAGATRLGDIGRHDATSPADPGAAAVAWFGEFERASAAATPSLR